MSAILSFLNSESPNVFNTKRTCKFEIKPCVENFVLCILIAAPQDGFIAPHVWEIVCRKNLTTFNGCHCSQLYIMISLSFRKIETKNLNSDPHILIFLVLGTNHKLHNSYLNIRSDYDYDIEAATNEYSQVPLKTFVMLAQDINIFV